MSSTRRKFLLLLILALLLLPSNVLANSAEERANDLSARIMSPFCPGVTLHECPSAEAIRLRDRIAGWFASGWTEDQVMQELRSEYGDGIRALPPPTGFGFLTWLLPIVVLGTGGVIVWLLLRHAAHRPLAPEVIQPEEFARVESELASLRSER